MSVELVVGPLALLVEAVFFHLLQEGLLPDMRLLFKFFKDAGVIAGGSVLLAIVLFAITFYEHVNGKNIAAFWFGVLVIIFFCLGSLVAWHNEVKKVKNLENALAEMTSAKPDIQGAAFDFKISSRPVTDSTVKGRKQVGLGVTFQIEICNHKPKQTNLMEVRMDGSRLRHPITFIDIYFPPKFIETPLECGIGKTIPVLATALILDVAKADLYASSINLDDLDVGVIDGFGNFHMLITSPAESLWFGNP
jgi:hypothetical protein